MDTFAEETFKIAKKLSHTGLWRGYLSNAEGCIFLQQCCTFERWKQFILHNEMHITKPKSIKMDQHVPEEKNGNQLSGKRTKESPPSPKKDSRNGADAVAKADDKKSNDIAEETSIHPLNDFDADKSVSYASSDDASTLGNVVMFRIRTMISEQYFTRLFSHSKELVSSVVDMDRDLVFYENAIREPTDNIQPNKDDDYDMVDKPIDDTPVARTQDQEFAVTIDEKNLDPDLIPIDDMYYTLEEMIEKSPHVQTPNFNEMAPPEPSNGLTENLSKGQENKENRIVQDIQDKDLHPSVKVSKQRMEITAKRLYDIIHRYNPSKVKKIKSLLVELKPCQSKWANQDRVGQENLYEACEKVLNDLRGYTEHSLPFLQKVSKKDAPDYYDVIKNPMDLGTMGKKLKNLEYLSKKDFHDDLNLIWSNCLAYNTHPESIYRKHGILMKKKANDLMKKVPEISIAVRSTRPPVDGGDSDSDNDSQYTKPEIPAFVTPSVESPVASETHIETPEPHYPEKSPTVQPPVEIHTDTQVTDKYPIEPGSLQIRKWKDMTADTREKRMQFRLEQGSLPFPDQTALMPVPESLRELLSSEREYTNRNRRRMGLTVDEDKEKRKLLKAKNSAHHEEDDEPMSLEEFYFPDLLPVSISRLEDPFSISNRQLPSTRELFDGPSERLPSLSDYQEMRVEQNSRLAEIVTRNLNEMRRIKIAHAKIIAKETKFLEELLGLPPTPSLPYSKTIAQDPPFCLNDKTASASLRLVVSKMLAHSGFDASAETCLCIMQDICTTFFLNIGKLMRLYIDKFGQTMTPENILEQVLKQSGLVDIQQLEYYIRIEVFRYGSKLLDLRRRLEVAYDHLLQDEMAVEGDEMEIDEHEDQVIAGSMFEDVGVDILGLKEIGIDAFSIPTELWNKKAEKPIKARVKRRLFVEKADNTQDAENVKQSPIEWSPIDVSKQIGLLKAYFEKKVADDDLVEDDAKPKSKIALSKSKVLMKVAQLGRKRVNANKDDSENAKKKKKSANMDPTLKAAKEAEKAKKAAEKVEKQKLREEKKLQKKSKKPSGGPNPSPSPIDDSAKLIN